MSERGWADVCRWCGEKDRWAWGSVDAQACADGVGARERLEMRGEKEPVGTSVDARMVCGGCGWMGATEKMEKGGEKDQWA